MLCDKQALRSNMSIIRASGGWLGGSANLDWTQPHTRGYPVVLMDKWGSWALSHVSHLPTGSPRHVFIAAVEGTRMQAETSK